MRPTVTFSSICTLAIALASTLCITCLCAQATTKLLTYEFPNDRTVGKLYFAKVLPRNLVQHYDAKEKGLWARGAVQLPADQQLSFLFTYAGAEDASFLDRLSQQCMAKIIEVRMRDMDNVTNETVAHLAHLKEIVHLVCDDTDITDDALAVIGALPNLAGLSINGTLIKGSGLTHLVGLPKLTSLEYSHVDLRHSDLQPIEKLKHLEALSLSKTCISDGTLVSISQAKNINFLDISGNNITDKGVAKLTALTKLAELNISDTKVTAHSISSLAKLSRLAILKVTNSQFSAKDLLKMKQSLPNCRFVLVQRGAKFDRDLFAPLK